MDTNLTPDHPKLAILKRALQGKNLAILVFILILLLFFYGRGEEGIVESAASAQTMSSHPPLPVQNSILESRPALKNGIEPNSITLTARAGIVYELDSQKVLYSKNIEQPLPVASLTKLTTALLVSRHLSPEQVVTVDNQKLSDIADPKLDLVYGEKIRVGDLVEGMLVASANDAAEVLAEAVGKGDRQKAVVMMNSLASNLGLKSTHYANPTGFDHPSGYSTILDVLTVVFEVERTPWLMSLLSESRGEVRSVDGKLTHRFNTTNRLLSTDYVTGGKTGFTDGALGNLVVFAKSPNQSPLVAIIIGSEDREGEMQRLLEWTFASYNW